MTVAQEVLGGLPSRTVSLFRLLTVLASNLWDSESWSCLLARQGMLGHLAHVTEALLIWGAVDDKLVGFSLFVPC